MKFPLSLDLRKKSLDRPGVDIIDADQVPVINLRTVQADGTYDAAGKIVDLLNMLPVIEESLLKVCGVLSAAVRNELMPEAAKITFTEGHAHLGAWTIGEILDEADATLGKLEDLSS